jgi:cyanophycin synthetase
VLPKDVSIVVQRNGNVAFDVTDIVHPEVAAAVSLAARVVGLDIAGIDLVAEDISKPLGEQGGAIVEVNAGPGLLMHLKPAEGQPRPVGKAIVDHLFADDETGRIPVVGITGSSGKTRVAKILARFIHLSGSHVGLACSDGLFSGERQIENGNCATWTAAQKLLMNRKVEAAVIENSVSTILAEGLGYDRCQVGIVTNIQSEKHFGAFYIETPEQVYNVLRTQVDVVLGDGVAVLNAEDPLVAQMAELCDGEVIFFATNSESPVIRKHLKQGGRAVLQKGGGLILASSLCKILLTNPAAKPISAQSMQPLLPAVAAAWALGISPDLISAGVKTYSLEQPDV